MERSRRNPTRPIGSTAARGGARAGSGNDNGTELALAELAPFMRRAAQDRDAAAAAVGEGASPQAKPPGAPAQEPVEVKVDDLLAMNALFIDLYIPGGYAKLPELVKQLHEGNMAPMRATLPLLLQTSSFARVMHYAINCTDDPTTSLDDLALDGVAEVYARLVTDDGQSYANICPALDLPQLPGIDLRALRLVTNAAAALPQKSQCIARAPAAPRGLRASAWFP